MSITEGLAQRLIGQNGDRIRQSVAVLLADSDLLMLEIDVFVVERDDLIQGHDITSMDAAEKIAWE